MSNLDNATLKRYNEKFCVECGEIINAKAEICPKCGCRQPNTGSSLIPGATGGDRWLITLILCFLAGYLGVHRFYTGHIAIGVIQLLTGGGCGIWVLIDLIMILTGSYRDAQGNPIKV